MARVITFSKKMPVGHRRKGEITNFRKKIIAGTKLHTIRKGTRWNIGDFFYPREWIDKPYRSKMSRITEDIQVVNIWEFEVRIEKNTRMFYLDGKKLDVNMVRAIAHNDGLSFRDFLSWFEKPFQGQIICWSREVNYAV